MKKPSKRWNYVARTTPNISDLLRPLEYKIKEEFIPAIVGKQYIPDKLRDIFGLPPRMGGLGISNIQETAELEYTNSIQVTASLTEALYLQDHSYEVDDRAHNEIMKDVMKRKEAHYNRAKIKVADQCSDQQKRQLLLASEKGASSWLTSLPLKEYGFLLNKQEFHDALALRYNLTLTDLNRPKSCECGVVNTINHCLTCKLGGYVALRHDAIKETTASLLKEGGCRDVQSEPMLLSVTTERLSSGTNTTDGARLDVSARSFWTPLDRAFTDIRVLNPQAQSNCVPIKQMYINHERQKKNMYMDRVLQVEKATFTPLVFSTTGGMGEEAIKFYKHLAGKISRKTNQEYPYVISYIRRKLRFVLLRTCIISLRGYRGKRRGKEEDSSELDLNLGPIIEHH